jgi:hypothetical protein
MGKNIVHCGDAGAGGITHTEQRARKDTRNLRLNVSYRCGQALQQLVSRDFDDRHLRSHELGKWTVQLVSDCI